LPNQLIDKQARRAKQGRLLIIFRSQSACYPSPRDLDRTKRLDGHIEFTFHLAQTPAAFLMDCRPNSTINHDVMTGVADRECPFDGDTNSIPLRSGNAASRS